MGNVNTLLEKRVSWLNGDGPEADIVFGCRGMLSRNLSDFPFPSRCTDTERDAIENRVGRAVNERNALPRGQYLAVRDMDPREVSVLAERQLVTDAFLQEGAGRAVFISDDQSLSIMVNEYDHVCIMALASGLQPEEVWRRLDAADNALASALDYAFDEKLGYLSARLERLGTGLKFAALLHLPALTMENRIPAVEERLREGRHSLFGFFGGGHAGGDLYILTNHCSLGRSEEEIVFHLKHAASEVIDAEKNARKDLLKKGAQGIEDRIGRAQGIARGARLLAFEEGLGLLSALRLGVEADLVRDMPLSVLNELLIDSQRAHMELKHGQACDELELSADRAELFRARLS